MNRTTDGRVHVRMCMDDAIVFNLNPASNISAIHDSVARLRLHGLKLAPHKGRLGFTSIDILGHKITPAGLRPSASKVTALSQTPTPTNVSRLQSK